jgi:hypothetical protein
MGPLLKSKLEKLAVKLNNSVASLDNSGRKGKKKRMRRTKSKTMEMTINHRTTTKNMRRKRTKPHLNLAAGVGNQSLSFRLKLLWLLPRLNHLERNVEESPKTMCLLLRKLQMSLLKKSVVLL